MKNKLFLLALLMMVISAAGIWAQNLPASIWTSPQSTVTEGRYRSNADDFIRPDAYAGVKFNRWFGMISFLWDENFSGIATLGYATKVSNVYLGGFYNGNLWAGAPANNYTSMETFPVPNGGVAGRPYNVYNYINVVPANVNNIALIVGAADMGFRITYRTNHQSFNESGIVTGNQLYKNYKAEGGYIAPQIAWAMAKDLTGNGIRPYATVDLVFNRDYLSTETSGPDSNGIEGVKIGRSSNHIDPSVGLGLGGYTFYNQDGFKASCDLDYVLTLNIYDNEYSYEKDGVYRTGTIKGTYSPASISLVEKSYVSNQVTPSLSGSWSEDRLSLKFKLNLPLTIISREDNQMDVNSSYNLVRQGANDSTFSFSFRPDVRLALQYKIIPGKLVLNAGARLQTAAITLEKVDRVIFNDDVKTSSQTIHQDSWGSSFVSRFSLGPTFNLTDNVWIEAVTGVTNAYGNSGTIDVFAPGGLFSFGSILVALKF